MSNSPSASKLLRTALLTNRIKQGSAMTTVPSSTVPNFTKTTIIQSNNATKPHYTPVLPKDQSRADVIIAKSEPSKVFYVQQGKPSKRVKLILPNIRREPSKSDTPPTVKPIVIYPKSNFIKPSPPTATSESSSSTTQIHANFDPKSCMQGDTKWKCLNLNVKYNKSTGMRNFSATYVHVDGRFETRTAERLIEMIGVSCFDVVISTILFNQSEELRNRAVLALLTRKSERKEIGTMTSPLHSELLAQFKECRKPKTRARRRPQPYVCQQTQNVKIRKTIINPFENSAKINELIGPLDIDERESVTESNAIRSNDTRVDVDNLSDYDKISCVSLPSTMLIPDSILNNPETEVHRAVERFTETRSISSAADEINPFNNTKITQSQYNKYSNATTAMRDLNTGKKRENNSFSLHDYRKSKKTCFNTEFIPQKTTVNDTNFINNGKTASTPVLNFTETVNNASVLNSNAANMTRDMRIWEELPTNRRDLIGGVKPEDWFHLATPDRLKLLTQEDRTALMNLQMYIDWKYCMEADEDNNLPIHIAVLNNDLDLLKRQCYMLKARNQSVDMGDANFNYSALQMCIVHEADVQLARELLRLGASPLELDDENRTALHLAAEATSHEYLEAMLQHMAASPREMLEAAELWTHEMSDYKAKELISCLFTFAVKKCDVNGHTPLTLAARMGHSEHVMLLLEQIVNTGEAVNFKSPLTGSTALYETVEATCHLAEKLGNKSTVPDKFSTTIQQLVRYGADPWIENGFGSNINTLIGECRMTSLNLLINDLICQSKFREIDVDIETDGPVNKRSQKIPYEGSKPFIIVKNESGGYNYEDPSIKRSGGKTKTKKDVLNVKANDNRGVMENNVNIDKKAAESGLKDLNAVQSMNSVKSGSDFPVKITSPHNIQSDKIIPSVENRQAVQIINNIPVNITSRQNISVVQNMPSVVNIHLDQNVQSFQNIPSDQSMPSVQNMPLVQNIPSVRNMVLGQNMTVPNLLAQNKVTKGPNVDKLQQEMKDSALDNSGKPIILNNLTLTSSVDFMKNINMKPMKIKVMSALPKRSHSKDSQEEIFGNEPAKRSAIVDTPKRFMDKPQNIVITPRKRSSSNQKEQKSESQNVAAPDAKLIAGPNTSDNLKKSSFNDAFLASVKTYRMNVHDWKNNKNNCNINAVERKDVENNSIITNENGQKNVNHLENIDTEKLEVGNTYHNDSGNVFLGFKSNDVNMSARKRCLELINNEKNVGPGEKKAKL